MVEERGRQTNYAAKAAGSEVFTAVELYLGLREDILEFRHDC